MTHGVPVSARCKWQGVRKISFSNITRSYTLLCIQFSSIYCRESEGFSLWWISLAPQNHYTGDPYGVTSHIISKVPDTAPLTGGTLTCVSLYTHPFRMDYLSIVLCKFEICPPSQKYKKWNLEIQLRNVTCVGSQN